MDGLEHDENMIIVTSEKGSRVWLWKYEIFYDIINESQWMIMSIFMCEYMQA